VEHLYLLTASISKLGTGGNPMPVADFQLPPVTQNVNGSFFAHMPDIVGSLTTKNTSSQTVSSCLNGIGLGSSPPPKTSGSSSGCGTAGSTSSSFEATGLSPSFSAILNVYPVIMTETRDLHGRTASDTVFLPPFRKRSKLAAVLDKRHPSREQVLDLFGSSSSYRIIPGSRHDNLWWVGKTVTLTEIMAGAQSSLADSRVDAVLPSNGSLQGGNYVWKGTGSLAPTISATKINTAVSQSNNAFLAGVFFAMAAAAAIALLQGVPDATPLPEWWPKLPRPQRNRIHFNFRAPPRLRASLTRVKRQFSSRRTTPS